jgi:hypothetical protein
MAIPDRQGIGMVVYTRFGIFQMHYLLFLYPPLILMFVYCAYSLNTDQPNNKCCIEV